MTNRERWKLSPTALLIAALLAACGGGSDNGGAVTATPTASTPTTPTTPVTPTPGTAAPTLSGNTALDGYNWINYRRALVGLPTLTRNATIDAVAQGHSNYLRLNNTVGHEQTSGLPGFTGATLLDRLTAGNYPLTGGYAFGEVISAASNTSGFYHAEELIAAIYHRFVLFEPVFKEVGTGAVTGTANYTYFTADLAASNGLGAGIGSGNVVTYPVNGQTGVPTNFFSDTESPDPVPDQNEVGYPISVHADSGRGRGNLTVQSFTVTPRGGAALSTRLLSLANGTATADSAAAIVPLSPLQGATTYDVTFRGMVHGAAVTREWSFTTK